MTGDRIPRLLVALVALGCVLIAAAPTFGVLVAGRVFQGRLSQGSRWGWGAARTVGLLAAGLVVLVSWVVELRKRQPLIGLRSMFRGPLVPIYVVAVGTCTAVIGTQVVNSTFLALPSDELGYGLGLKALALSLALTPGIGAAAIAASLTARLGKILGYSWSMAIGAGAVSLGFVGLVFFHAGLAAYVVAAPSVPS